MKIIGCGPKAIALWSKGICPGITPDSMSSRSTKDNLALPGPAFDSSNAVERGTNRYGL